MNGTIIYSAVKTKEAYDDTLTNGFNYSFIYFTNSREEAFDKFPYVISISDIDALDILLIDNTIPFYNKKEAQQIISKHDGIKYQDGMTHNTIHLVWNIGKLNKLKRIGEYKQDEKEN